jgi:hypothetical protein
MVPKPGPRSKEMPEKIKSKNKTLNLLLGIKELDRLRKSNNPKQTENREKSRSAGTSKTQLGSRETNKHVSVTKMGFSVRAQGTKRRRTT